MERVYDSYRSYTAQGDCYKYVHKCKSCGKILFEIPDFELRNHPEHVNIPNFCDNCGAKQ